APAREERKPDHIMQVLGEVTDDTLHILGLKEPLAGIGKFHIPADLVVDLWAFDGEGSSNRVFLFPHDVWACFVARSVRKECQQYQRLSILPLNPMESGNFFKATSKMSLFL